jgi:hypothetical protein
VDAGTVPANPGGKVEPTKNPKESADVVKTQLDLTAARDGRRSFTLVMVVAAPWHLYANPVGNENLLESRTEVTVYVGGKQVAAVVEYPKGKETTDASGATYRIYEETLKIAGNFPAGDGEVEVRVKITACKETTCLLPSVLKLK